MLNFDLPTVLDDAIAKFERWAQSQLLSEQEENAVELPLYHYTDWRGLQGIIGNQKIWFTHYRYLNDPSELKYGIDMAKEVARRLANDADGLVRLFLETLIDMFTSENLSKASLEFYIASLSRERDDLGQWRAYADNGRGIAIAFAPSMFRVVENYPSVGPGEFVGPVLYRIDEVCARHRRSIEQAASMFLDTANSNPELLRDREIGFPFMQELSRAIIASPLIWNSLTSKHPAYAHEREVRLIILGQQKELAPYVIKRVRGSESVPYIAHSMPLREPQNIVEVVIGPAAQSDAESNLRTQLLTLGVDPKVPITRSDIPYRAL